MAILWRRKQGLQRGLMTSLWFGIALSLPAAAADRLPGLKDPSYWMQLCTLLSTSKPAEALAACERAIELRPGDALLWARYGAVQLGLKQYPDAIASLEQALKRQPKNAQALTDECLAWASLNRKELALAACDKALQVNANWGDRAPVIAHHARSILLDQPAVYEAALKVYEGALKQTPNDSLTLFYRGEALVKLGQLTAAIAAFDQALKGNGNWGTETPMHVWYVRGIAQRSLGQLELAVQSFDRALQLDPNDAASWLQQGHSLRQLKRPTEALVAYTRAVELMPKASQALLGQCVVLNQLQQADAALAACQKAMQGDGDWSAADVAQDWNQQSQALAAQSKLEEALAAANRAVGMRPDWGEAWSDRAVVFWYLKRYKEALASVQQALTLNPNDARAWANQGRIWRSLNQPEKALAAYTEATNRDPNDAVTWANQSVVQWSLGKFDAALETANRALEANPKLVQGWQNRAVAMIALKNYPEAQVSYEQAIVLDKTNADAWAGLGLVLAQQQQYPKAIQALQTAVMLNPQNTIAQRALQALMEAKTPAPEKTR